MKIHEAYTQITAIMGQDVTREGRAAGEVHACRLREHENSVFGRVNLSAELRSLRRDPEKSIQFYILVCFEAQPFSSQDPTECAQYVAAVAELSAMLAQVQDLVNGKTWTFDEAREFFDVDTPKNVENHTS